MFTVNLETRKAFVTACQKEYPNQEVLSRTQINNVAKVHNLTDAAWLKSDDYRVGRGKYQLPPMNAVDKPVVVPMSQSIVTVSYTHLRAHETDS